MEDDPLTKLNEILKLKAMQSKERKFKLVLVNKVEKEGYLNLETERDGREDTDGRLTTDRPLSFE